MMKKVNLSLLFVIFLLFFVGQMETNAQTYKKQPQTGVIETRKELRDALKAGDSPRIIKLLTLEMYYLCAINGDSLYPLLHQLETYTAQNKRPVEKAM